MRHHALILLVVVQKVVQDRLRPLSARIAEERSSRRHNGVSQEAFHSLIDVRPIPLHSARQSNLVELEREHLSVQDGFHLDVSPELLVALVYAQYKVH